MLVGLVRALSHIIFDHTSFEAGGVRSLTEAEEPLALLGNEPLPANRRAGHLGGHGYRAAVPDLDFDVGYRGRCGLWRREVGCHRRSVRPDLRCCLRPTGSRGTSVRSCRGLRRVVAAARAASDR